MNDIQRIIDAHMIEIETVLEQNFFGLIGFNKVLEKSLSRASQQVEDDSLSAFLLDLTWEKNTFTVELTHELMTIGEVMIDKINWEQLLLDFDKFEENSVTINADDREYLINMIVKVENQLSDYDRIIQVNDLPISSVALLESQRDKVREGLGLLHGYYAKTLIK